MADKSTEYTADDENGCSDCWRRLRDEHPKIHAVVSRDGGAVAGPVPEWALACPHGAPQFAPGILTEAP